MSEASNTVFLTDRQNIMPDRRKSAKNALSIFLTVFALMIAVTAVILFVSGEAEMKTYQNMERHTVDIQADNIDRDILQVSSDLKILAHGRNMDGLWGDDGIPISSVLADLTDDFLNVSMYRGLYDQVRLLDENGMEIGRVNFNGGLPAIVPQDKLQNKKGRYYFDDAFKLSLGEVYISPLDLNIEHGEIELPLKPMIRFATPVFDRLGKKRGIVLLNYFGAKLLDRFSSQAETSRKSRTMLLNTDGYWLYGPNSEDEWGFMYEDRKDRTLANACPEAWKRIKSEESCQFETPQGMFTSKTVYPLLEVQKSNSRSSKAYSRSLRTVELNEYYWKVVSFVPSDVLYAHRDNHRSYAALVLALLSVTSLLGSWRVAKVVALRRQAEEEIKILAKFPAEDPNPVLRISKDGTVIYHNRSSEPLLEHWHYKDGKPLQDGWLQFALDALQDDDIKTVETEIGDKILSLTFAPISEKGFVNVYGLDITERKKTEHELRKLSTAVEQSPATVVITDIEGTIQYVNPSFTETTGYTSEEVIGQNPRILKSGDMPPDVYRQMWEAIRAGTVWRGEFHNIKKNGDFFWEAASISPIRDATGAITNFLAVKEDITDRKQAEIALTKSRDELESINEHLEQQTVFANEMAAQAEMANTAKSEFLANMSHEIRTPMNGVIGMTGLLLDTDLNDKQRRYAEAVRASGEALLSLINDILDFSKIESGKLEMETLDFDLHALLDDFAEMLALKAHDKGLEFLCGVAPETPAYLRGDPGRLRQILINLAGNAVKFTHDGEIAVLASLEAESNEDVLVRFLVRDTGIGIPVDNQDSIFHQFTQVDASTTRKYGGTGLGLAISKQLVEMMGGEIGVNSKEGLGSEFWFTARFLKQPEQERDLTPPADMHGVRILVVDDNATNREILMVKFKAWGAQPDEAPDGEKALLQLREAAEEGTPYQIAILDMHMPGMDGAELGEAVKADAAIADTRLVMMTSLGSRRDAGRFDKIGFTAYLTKPVRLSDLFDSLAAVLSGERPKAGMHMVTRHSIREIRRGNVRILLAEDNIVNQTVALGILKKLGLSADAVASGAEAVKALETIPYNLVLMDVQMPEMDGMEATGRIRDPQSNVLNHDIPIIAMTAHVMQGDREKCLEAGMNDYLSKPVVPQVLAGMLDKWLGAEDDRKEQKEKKGGRISESGSPVFDRKAMLERLMGDESLAKKITTVFLKDIPSQFTDLQNAVNSGNASLAGEIAHKIKGSVGNVGGLSVWDTAYAMEQAGKEKNMIDLLELLPQLEIQLNELKTAMENSF